LLDKVKEKIVEGIEVEGFIRSRDQIKHREAQAKTKKLLNREYPNIEFPDEVYYVLDSDDLWDEPHYDTDDCTEIALKPRDNLGDFFDLLQKNLITVFDLSNKKDWFYMLLAKNPTCSYGGGHTHVSVKGMSGDRSVDLVKDKLYPFQPFISLIGQNTSYDEVTLRRDYPYISYQKIKEERKDTRIKNINGGVSFKDSEDGRLSQDYDKGTLEVRFPSVSSIYQSLGVATFIKACIFQDGNKFQESNYDYILANLCARVAKYGVNANVGIKLPFKISLRNKDTSSITLSMSKVFSFLLKSYPFCEGLERAYKELDSKEREITKDFFSIFGKGYSMTDFYDTALRGFGKLDFISQCNKIHSLGEQEVFKETPIIHKIIPKPKKIIEDTDPTSYIDSRLFNITDEILHEVID